MKTKIVGLICSLALSGGLTSASAAGIPTITLTLQDAGNDQTAFSLSANYFFIETGAWVSSTEVSGIYEFDPVFTGWVNDPLLDGTLAKFDGFGSFNNPNGTDEGGVSSAQLVGLRFMSGDNSAFYLKLNLDDTLGIGQGDRVTYTPGADSTVIDVPFSSFNPGSYSYIDEAGSDVFGQDVYYNLNVVEATPEPSVLGLSVVSGAAGLFLIRRRTA